MTYAQTAVSCDSIRWSTAPMKVRLGCGDMMSSVTFVPLFFKHPGIKWPLHCPADQQNRLMLSVPPAPPWNLPEPPPLKKRHSKNKKERRSQQRSHRVISVWSTLSLFRDVTQRILVVFVYRRFGTAYRARFPRSSTTAWPLRLDVNNY